MSATIGISVVVPCYNEEVSLRPFLQEITKTMDALVPILRENRDLLRQTLAQNLNSPTLCSPASLASSTQEFIPYELIFVNDGSRDSTLSILEDIATSDANPNRRVQVFSFSRNFGKEAAILAGLERASGEGVVLLDADLQDPPGMIADMTRIWLESSRQTKVIYARRTTRAGESKIRAALSEAFYKISNFISEVKIESGVRDFRLMDKEVVQALLEMKEYHRFSKAMFAWVGFKRECLEYEYIPHFKESSSWSFWKLFKYAIEGIVSFSTMPLRIAFVLGFFISAFAVCFGIYRIIDTILHGNAVAGYPSLIVIITFIGGIQLMLLGVIGEYIARIYEQVKMRPHFILNTRATRMSGAGSGAVLGVDSSEAESSSAPPKKTPRKTQSQQG